MYSLVLMSAMSTAPATPEFNGFFRDLFHGCQGCYGCNGCYGGAARYSCFGGCSGCYGCGGCDGFLGFGLVRRPLFDRAGCYGSCYGSSCYGTAAYSCYGGPAMSYAPSYGCYGGSIASVPMSTIPNTAIPTIPYAPVDPAPATSAPERSGFTPANYATTASASNDANRATVIVKLPTDAKLYAEGKLLALTSAERKFVTPPLPAGEFVYRFKIEYERDGETLSVTKKVPVKAGGSVTVEFVDLTSKAGTKGTTVTTAEPASRNEVVPAVIAPVSKPAASEPPPAVRTQDRATITVKLPPGATLYIDDKKKDSSPEPVREFTTPPIPRDKEYAYLMKAEVVRNGRPESLTQKVSFRAGEKVTVDFTTVGGK